MRLVGFCNGRDGGGGPGGKVAQASHGNYGARRPSPTYIISLKLMGLDVTYVMLNRYPSAPPELVFSVA